MQNDILFSLTRLSDAELVDRMKALLASERDTVATLIAHLAEMDTRDVHLREGYPSLFVYCRDVLGLSEWEAYKRIEVARAARRFPVILEWLADGSLGLTTVRLLAPHLNAANHREVLEAARGKRKPEIEALVARLSPRPDVACSIRRLPTPLVPSIPETLAAGPALPSDGLAASDAATGMTMPATAMAETIRPRQPLTTVVPAPPAVTMLSPGRYKLQVTIGEETLEKLRLAKDMLGPALPSGDEAAILDRALTVLLTDLAKKRFAGSPRPRDSRPRSDVAHPAAAVRRASRTVPAAVRRAVWLRDLGRCAFEGAGAHRCNERRFVGFHHVDPYVLGGEATVDGIQLRCRRHNDYEGRLYFGGVRRRGRELVPEQVRLSANDSTGPLLGDHERGQSDGANRRDRRGGNGLRLGVGQSSDSTEHVLHPPQPGPATCPPADSLEEG
jgi:hypothetical protein